MKLKPDKLFERYTTLLHSKNSAVDVDPKFCSATESNRFAVGKPVSVPVSNHTERILKIVFTASTLSAQRERGSCGGKARKFVSCRSMEGT